MPQFALPPGARPALWTHPFVASKLVAMVVQSQRRDVDAKGWQAINRAGQAIHRI